MSIGDKSDKSELQFLCQYSPRLNKSKDKEWIYIFDIKTLLYRWAYI